MQPIPMFYSGLSFEQPILLVILPCQNSQLNKNDPSETSVSLSLPSAADAVCASSTNAFFVALKMGDASTFPSGCSPL